MIKFVIYKFIIYMDLLNINNKQIQVYTTHLWLFGDLGIQGWFELLGLPHDPLQCKQYVAGDILYTTRL